MKKTLTKDMTTGSAWTHILNFMLPLMCGLIFQQFYNMVDTIVVGKYLGVNALAGVGSTGSINFLVLGFCSGVCTGFAIPIAQKFGQKDFVSLRKFVANTAYLSIGFSIVITLATCLPCKEILMLMNTKDEFFQEAYSYIFVIFLGIPAIVLYNVLSGIIRSLGDSRSPLYFLLLSSAMNIVLDIVSVQALHMGVAGPAWATVISQGVSGVCCLIYMRKKFDILKMSREETRPNAHYMKQLCSVGIPMGLQYSITAIGSIVMQTVVNGLGTVYVASVTTGSKVSQLLCCPMDALGATVATYTGQNIGARRLDRVQEGRKVCTIIGTVYSIFAFIVLYLFGGQIASLFLDQSEPAITAQVLENAKQFLLVNSALYIPLILIYVYRFTIQGLGFSKAAVFAGVFEMAARCIMGFVIVPMFGFTAVCFSNPAAWIAADIFLIPFYSHIMKKLEKQFSLESPVSAPEAIAQ